MKTIGEIKEEFSAAREADWNAICQMFFESAGKFVTRDAIMTRLWESDEFIDDNTLTVNVARLRKKLEEAGMHDVIRTKKGIGYMLV